MKTLIAMLVAAIAGALPFTIVLMGMMQTGSGLGDPVLWAHTGEMFGVLLIPSAGFALIWLLPVHAILQRFNVARWWSFTALGLIPAVLVACIGSRGDGALIPCVSAAFSATCFWIALRAMNSGNPIHALASKLAARAGLRCQQTASKRRLHYALFLVLLIKWSNCGTALEPIILSDKGADIKVEITRVEIQDYSGKKDQNIFGNLIFGDTYQLPRSINLMCIEISTTTAKSYRIFLDAFDDWEPSTYRADSRKVAVFWPMEGALDPDTLLSELGLHIKKDCLLVRQEKIRTHEKKPKGRKGGRCVYGLLPVCKHNPCLVLGSTAHVYPASELGSIARAIMGYSRVWS